VPGLTSPTVSSHTAGVLKLSLCHNSDAFRGTMAPLNVTSCSPGLLFQSCIKRRQKSLLRNCSAAGMPAPGQALPCAGALSGSSAAWRQPLEMARHPHLARFPPPSVRWRLSLLPTPLRQPADRLVPWERWRTFCLVKGFLTQQHSFSNPKSFSFFVVLKHSWVVFS